MVISANLCNFIYICRSDYRFTFVSTRLVSHGGFRLPPCYPIGTSSQSERIFSFDACSNMKDMLNSYRNMQLGIFMTDFYGRELSEHEIGYLAGIMDGEGTIHISRPITRHRDCKSPIYQTYIAVTNTEMVLLNWLQERIGGIIRSIPTDKKTGVIRRPIWRWYCPIYRIREFCKMLIPYSIIKKREFEIMYEIRGTYRNQAKPGRQGVQKVPDEDIAFRHRCYLELKELHIRPNLRHKHLHQNDHPTSQ